MRMVTVTCRAIQNGTLYENEQDVIIGTVCWGLVDRYVCMGSCITARAVSPLKGPPRCLVWHQLQRR